MTDDRADSRADMRHITHWVFDLDDTLYPSDAPIMAQVERRMTQYVARLMDLPETEAKVVQKSYWRDYGTTLNGLMANHTIDVHEFLDFVHDVDATVIKPDPDLARHIAALPGKRLVYTNGSLKHAENILDHMGLTHLFNDIFDVEASGFQPKPLQAGFDRFIGHHALPAHEAVFFEDSLRNLKTAHAMGFTTVLVRAKAGTRSEDVAMADEHPDHIHHAIDCLPTFLGDVRVRES
ncbi:pyrimidine 5'-nucleotidase [Maricaulis sp.]|uniref:pyrimidine 5'-nucleotidase n=1 Tax=Maricaulis sp. TaxID=1486257 RepID=UPI002B26724D|nr:pyrimidine 5'-nucleotidase [Maricaulis sp.]